MSSAHTLTELYDQFAAPAYSLAFTITQHRSAAERVVTDAFATTWQQFEREPASEQSFFSALMAAVRAASLACGNGAARTPPSIQLPDAEVVAAAPRALVDAMRGLSDLQRRVLVLAYFGGLGIGDIAEQLRESPSLVRASLESAMRHLRSVLVPV